MGITGMTMAEGISSLSLMRLMTWLSPAFPVGAFAYSAGLERAIADRLVQDETSLREWLTSLTERGSLWNDAVLCSVAHRQYDSVEAREEICDLAEALAGGAERHQEQMLLGQAFIAAASSWISEPLLPTRAKIAYPVAVGLVAASQNIACEACIVAYFHAAVSQLVSASIRCGLIGQVRGVAIMAGLEPVVLASAGRAVSADVDDLGSASFMADICALRHETLTTRLFRS
jgi:urease accessory protein